MHSPISILVFYIISYIQTEHCCRPAKSRDDVKDERVMAVVRGDDLDERELTTLLHRHLNGTKQSCLHINCVVFSFG